MLLRFVFVARFVSHPVYTAMFCISLLYTNGVIRFDNRIYPLQKPTKFDVIPKLIALF